MAFPHHQPDDQRDLISRFLDQANGTAKRKYPEGRIDATDDGQTTFAMAVDDRHRVIKIVFPIPMKWIAMDVNAAEELRDALTERIIYLKTGDRTPT